MIDLIVFPTDRYYSYLKKYIFDKKFENPIYIGYDFNKAEICDISCETYEGELRLKSALKFIKEYSEKRKAETFRVFLYNPDISYHHDDLDLEDFLADNITELNYCVKKCERLWRTDFKQEWLKDERIKYINL